jgi:hypothetical protein
MMCEREKGEAAMTRREGYLGRLCMSEFKITSKGNMERQLQSSGPQRMDLRKEFQRHVEKVAMTQ